MTRLSPEDEEKLMVFIKDWLKLHGYNQKDFANELNINSSRSSEIKKRLQDIYKKGGLFNVANQLIKIEQSWLNVKTHIKDKENTKSFNQLDIKDKENSKSFNQLDINYQLDIDTIDGLVDQMDNDYKK
tara:strand:- start:2599 stop:2985 length:387 start_codon:yes stop_codon:yes gene_type:complete